MLVELCKSQISMIPLQTIGISSPWLRNEAVAVCAAPGSHYIYTYITNPISYNLLTCTVIFYLNLCKREEKASYSGILPLGSMTGYLIGLIYTVCAEAQIFSPWPLPSIVGPGIAHGLRSLLGGTMRHPCG